MTRRQMNSYLKKIGGLESGNFTDITPFTDSYIFECGSGWFQLIHDLIEDLIKLGWDKRVSQVKEKYGGLRFYIGSGTREINNRIDKAESDSYNICEMCGNPGQLRNLRWEQTLCDEHYEQLLKNKKK